MPIQPAFGFACGSPLAFAITLTALALPACSYDYVIPDSGLPTSVESSHATATDRLRRGLIATVPPATNICDVWMELIHDGEVSSNPVCIKKPGTTFAFPAPIFLKGKEGAVTGTQFNGMCAAGGLAADGVSSGEPSAKSSSGDGDRKICAWSYQYRDSYPFTFKLWTASGEPLAHFAHVIRVFRNGKLVFAWKDDNVLASLSIPGQVLAAALMPYGAPMDLRIIPTGSPDDPSVDTQVSQNVDPVTSRLKIVAGVLLGPQGSGAPILPEIACVHWMVLKAYATALQIVGKTPATALPPQPAGCVPPQDGSAARLHDQVVAAIQSGVQTASTDIDTGIADLRAQFGSAIAVEAEKARAAVIADYRDKPLPNGLTAERTADQINQLAEQGGQIFDSIDASVKAILANVRQLVKDRDTQAREFAAVTDALAENGSVFEAFTKNPSLVDGEKALDMHYGDKFQFFFLAPWHGLPIRVTRNVGTDLSLATAIPILDLAGFRYQKGTGRSQSVRLGAGFMYFKDELQELPPGASSTNDSVFNVAAEANVNWFGFSVGAGYVLNDRDFGGVWKNDRVRVIVGADLLKLFGNTPAEVYAF